MRWLLWRKNGITFWQVTTMLAGPIYSNRILFEYEFFLSSSKYKSLLIVNISFKPKTWGRFFFIYVRCHVHKYVFSTMALEKGEFTQKILSCFWHFTERSTSTYSVVPSSYYMLLIISLLFFHYYFVLWLVPNTPTYWWFVSTTWDSWELFVINMQIKTH